MASKLLGAAGALGAEAIKLMNWLLHFGCALEEFRVIVANLEDWMDNFCPPWDTYRAMMACHLSALDKHPGVCHIGIRKTLCRAIAKSQCGQKGTRQRRHVGFFNCVQVLRPV